MAKFVEETGLSKGGFAENIGRDPSIVRRWLYDGIMPKPNALRRIIRVIEERWNRAGWFEKHRREAEQWRLKRLKTVAPRHTFVTHSPTMWMELDDVLRGAGNPHHRQYPIAYEVACDLLDAAEAELARIDDEALREKLAIEIIDWREQYGCD